MRSVTGRKRSPRPAARRKAFTERQTGNGKRETTRDNPLRFPLSVFRFPILKDHVFRQLRIFLALDRVEPCVGVGNRGSEVETERHDQTSDFGGISFDLDEVADRSFVEGYAGGAEPPLFPPLLVAKTASQA